MNDSTANETHEIVYPISLTDFIPSICILLVIYLLCIFLIKDRQSFLKLRNRVLIPLTAAGGLVIYFIGYMNGGTSGSLTTLAIRSFLSTFHMFFLHSDLLEVREAMHENKTYMFFFAVIHLSAFLLSFMVILQLFGKHFISRLKLKISNPLNSYIFFGINEESATLGKNLLKNDKKRFVVFLDKRISNKINSSKPGTNGTISQNKETAFERICRTDALLINKEYSGKSTFKSLGLEKLIIKGDTHLFLLSDDENYNIQSALKILEEIGQMKNFSGTVVLYLKSYSDYITDIFYKRIKNKNIEVHIINPSRLSATELVLHYPPVNFIEKDTEKAMALSGFETMILGFGETGNYVLRSLVEFGQFYKKDFHATVIDKEMDCKEGSFLNRYPGLKHYNITYRNTDIHCTEFWELLKKKINTLNYLVICLGDDMLNIRTAMDIKHFITRETDRNIPIMVKVHDNPDYEFMKTSAQIFDTIHIFGCYENIFTEDIIVDEERTAAAKKIHDYYNQKKEEKDRISWNNLSQIKKTTNVSAAMHLYTKLEMAGLDYNKIRSLNSENEFLSLLREERLINLAKGEHLHWNATLFANEWDTWPLQEIPADTSVNKNEKRKKHACLVDWNDLDKVRERFGENYKDYDKDSVRKIYELIKNGIITQKQFNKSRE